MKEAKDIEKQTKKMAREAKLEEKLKKQEEAEALVRMKAEMKVLIACACGKARVDNGCSLGVNIVFRRKWGLNPHLLCSSPITPNERPLSAKLK